MKPTDSSDGDGDTMAEEMNAGLGNALSSELLSNPALLQAVGALLGGKPPAANNTADIPSLPPDGLRSLLSDPQLMEKLPQMMAMLSPLLSAKAPSEASSSPTAEPALPSTSLPVAAPAAERVPSEAHASLGTNSASKQRDALLCALKPFLSPERQHAVDSLLQLSRLGDLIHRIR